jgi:3-oxoacyl-[acyl-carrier protein] reductase
LFSRAIFAQWHSYKDKVALITGGSRGIGKGIVERFLEEGADVAFTYVSSPEKANALAEELAPKTGRKVLAIQSDAGDFNAAQAAVDQVVLHGARLDILVNNAGITKDQLLMRMSEADFDAVMNTNMKSVFNMTKAVMRTMLKQRSGSIINMSSVVGVQGNAGQANYAASKAASSASPRAWPRNWAAATSAAMPSHRVSSRPK